MNDNPLLRMALLILVASMLFSLAGQNVHTPPQPLPLSYSEFLHAVEAGEVERVAIEGSSLRGVRTDGRPFTTYSPNDGALVGELLDAGVSIEARPQPKAGWLTRLLVSMVPFLLLVALWAWYLRTQTGPGGPFGFVRSRARRIAPEKVTVRLSDVAGVDEAREEVGELVAFLRDPSRFRSLGGTIPRGVLMVGPPGTGKTLLARAIAGEAGVPFFSVSGSEFVEMFVGVGASRVRDLFAEAKRNAPCIVFIDEIDAVGRRRGAGLGGGHDEREQTLNQILVEMDGFEGNEGVIVLAATNRADVLDPALLRPGRFDRQVVVPLPDVLGRAQILRLHMRKLPLAEDVDPALLARGTPGFSGADLASLVNEAALLTARAGRERVGMEAFERARDKLLMGAERRSVVLTEAERRRIAVHEAGHAIVGRLAPDYDPVHKVSILPRGRALGATVFLPEHDRRSVSRRRLESEIATALGGRAAEEIVFGKEAVSTGAADDIERATRIARDMVTRFGLSPAMGPVAYGKEEDEVFLGRPVTRRAEVSGETARRIDAEMRAIVERNHERARRLLTEHRDVLERMAEALLAHETLDASQIDALMAGHGVAPPDLDRGSQPPPPPPGDDRERRRRRRRTPPRVGPPLAQS